MQIGGSIPTSRGFQLTGSWSYWAGQKEARNYGMADWTKTTGQSCCLRNLLWAGTSGLYSRVTTNWRLIQGKQLFLFCESVSLPTAWGQGGVVRQLILGGNIVHENVHVNIPNLYLAYVLT